MKFYVFTPHFHVRPKNTDWLYNLMLPQITNFDPRVSMYLQQSTFNSLTYNGRFVANILQTRLNVPIPAGLLPEFASRFNLSDVRHSGADLIYGHAPRNKTGLPVICHTGPIFEEQLRACAIPEHLIERERRDKQGTIERSQLVTLHSATGADTIRRIAGKRTDRIRVLPFFLPHLKAVSQETVERKFAEIENGRGRIRLLFVGREARRKGLASAVEAFIILNARMPNRLELEIVSTFADGNVELPVMPNLVVRGETPRAQIQEKMRQAHVVLMPSLFETFGWVYLEAMAAGAIAVAGDLAQQREILAEGRAGLLVGNTGAAVAEVLETVLQSAALMLKIALAGRSRLLAEYAPEAVASKFFELGLEAKELFGQDQTA